jgi:hypothetical protein
MLNWENTKNKYIFWLSQNDLRKIFSSRIKYDNMSLWWLTKLIDRDFINDNTWYYDLNKTINRIENNDLKTSFISLFLNFLKKLTARIFFSFFFKLLIKDTFNSSGKLNCLYVTQSNLTEIQGNVIDKQYGKFSLKDKENNIYLIELEESFRTIFNIRKIRNLLKKIPLEYLIVNGSISPHKIIKIYLGIFLHFFYLKNQLKYKNYFKIKGIDCSKILKPQLYISFFGSIQDQVVRGEQIFSKIKKFEFKNFITYYEFFPGSRAIYYFAKKSKVNNIISLNHGNTSDNDLFFSLKKSEFSNKNDYINYSPKPDYFTCKGKSYYRKLSNLFNAKKIFKTGSFKIELNQDFETCKSVNIKKINKIYLVCGLNDYWSFIKHLNNLKKLNFKIIVLPHPINKKRTSNDFKLYLKHKFLISKISKKRNFFKKNDLIIFGDSSLGFELALKNYNVVRLYHPDYVPTFDMTNDIPVSSTLSSLKSFLDGKREKIKKNQIIENYFFKFDNKATNRFQKYLKNL